MINFTPERLSKSKLHELAEEFRSMHPIAQKVPVDIEELIEVNLGIEIVPEFALNQKAGVEAFLSVNMKQIWVDGKYYLSDLTPRHRFTLAEEVGHFWLHQDIYKNGVHYGSTDEFIEDYKKMDEDDLGWIEFQAKEFAGRLLVPRDLLVDKIEEQSAGIHKYLDKYSGEDDTVLDPLIESVSKIICHHFGVSWKAIRSRIKSENLYYLFKLS